MKRNLTFGIVVLVLALALIAGAQVTGKYLGFTANRFWDNNGVLSTDNRIQTVGTSNAVRFQYSEGVYSTLAEDSSDQLVLTNGVFKQAYDAAAYYTITQADGAGVTFNATSDGTASFTFSDPVAIAGPLTLSGTPQTLTGAGAVNITTSITWIVTTAADALTLADGAEGQIKFIVMKTDGGEGTLTPSHPGGFATIKFNDVGDSCQLLFTNGAWHLVGQNGCTVA